MEIITVDNAWLYHAGIGFPRGYIKPANKKPALINRAG